MAKVVWTEPALSDLDAIADYIALDKPSAARELVRRVLILYVMRSERRLRPRSLTARGKPKRR